MQVGLPHKHCSVAIPDGQNLRQKLQAVGRNNKPKDKSSSLAVSDHRRAITVGRALRTLHVDAKVTRVFQISGKMKNCRY